LFDISCFSYKPVGFGRAARTRLFMLNATQNRVLRVLVLWSFEFHHISDGLDVQNTFITKRLWYKNFISTFVMLSFRQDLELETPVGNISSIVIHQVSWSSEQSFVQSQHPLTQWNQRGRRWGSVEKITLNKKISI